MVYSLPLSAIILVVMQGGGECKTENSSDMLDANLGVSDDDLLGDFGDDFNILEFADALDGNDSGKVMKFLQSGQCFGFRSVFLSIFTGLLDPNLKYVFRSVSRYGIVQTFFNKLAVNFREKKLQFL